jgi:hypothetical protein
VPDQEPLDDERVPHAHGHRDQLGGRRPVTDERPEARARRDEGAEQDELLEEGAADHLVEGGDDRVRRDRPRECRAEPEHVPAERQVGNPHHVVGQDVPGTERAAEQHDREQRGPRRGPERPVSPRTGV